MKIQEVFPMKHTTNISCIANMEVIKLLYKEKLVPL